ncbi:MAG: glycosyltransferase [Actinomycetota bacterium]|nr:glycosyltransferase [Actinomycetota bacterium]
MRRIAVLSLHTSPLAQPGTGDGGGMNVYVRELTAALARSGVRCDVFTRADAPGLAREVRVEPNLVVHHVRAGPPVPLDKARFVALVPIMTEAIAAILARPADGVGPVELVHANYWLSGLVGHALKHRLGVPLVSTFHTLERVKANAHPEDADPDQPDQRARAEAEVIGCSDAVLASCSVEAAELVAHYGAAPDRIVTVAPGVDRAFFSPGDQRQARRAVGIEADGPLVLFVGRIQPLKGLQVAVRSFARLSDLGVQGARLAIVGGPSGPDGGPERDRLVALADRLGIAASTRFVAPQRHELLSSWYRAASCCVVPSRSESFGLVALEAAACAIPVVASAVGGLTTLIEDGVTGYLVERDDEAGFARRLAELCADPLAAAAMGASAAEGSRRYTWPVAASRLLQTYERLVSRAPVSCF